MASSTHASDEKSSNVLDLSDPLAMASSSAATTSVLAMDSIEPLVDTGAVSSAVQEEPVAGSSGLSDSGGMASPVVDGDSPSDEELSAAMPLTRHSFRPMNSDEIRSMWNWQKIFSRLESHQQCVQFAQDQGLIASQKQCTYHHKPMSLTTDAGQLGMFRCRKSNCRIRGAARAKGTWFENAKLPLPQIFQIMYAFSEGLTYYQTQKQLTGDNYPVVSSRTVTDWFDYCRETVGIYELENRNAEGKIGGPGKTVRIDKCKFGKRICNRERHLEGHWLIGMIEAGSDDLRLEVCPDNESSAEILMPLIKAHVQVDSIIYTDYWQAYCSLPEHGYIHNKVNHIEYQWKGLRKQLRQKQYKHNFADWLCEYLWRRRIMINHLDPYAELIKAIKYVYA